MVTARPAETKDAETVALVCRALVVAHVHRLLPTVDLDRLSIGLVDGAFQWALRRIDQGGSVPGLETQPVGGPEGNAWHLELTAIAPPPQRIRIHFAPRAAGATTEARDDDADRAHVDNAVRGAGSVTREQATRVAEVPAGSLLTEEREYRHRAANHGFEEPIDDAMQAGEARYWQDLADCYQPTSEVRMISAWKAKRLADSVRGTLPNEPESLDAPVTTGETTRVRGEIEPERHAERASTAPHLLEDANTSALTDEEWLALIERRIPQLAVAAGGDEARFTAILSIQVARYRALDQLLRTANDDEASRQARLKAAREALEDNAIREAVCEQLGAEISADAFRQTLSRLRAAARKLLTERLAALDVTVCALVDLGAISATIASPYESGFVKDVLVEEQELWTALSTALRAPRDDPPAGLGRGELGAALHALEELEATVRLTDLYSIRRCVKRADSLTPDQLTRLSLLSLFQEKGGKVGNAIPGETFPAHQERAS